MEENTPNSNNIINNHSNYSSSLMNLAQQQLHRSAGTLNTVGPGSQAGNSNVSATPMTAVATGPAPTPVAAAPPMMSYPWHVNTTGGSAGMNFSSVVLQQQQPLQVNAGSCQQGQPGFLLPNVNQLPMPATIGIPMYSAVPQQQQLPGPSCSVAAAQGSGPLGAALPPGKRKDHPGDPDSLDSSKRVKLPANMENHNGMMNMIMNICMEPSVVSSYSSSDNKNGSSSTSASCAAGGGNGNGANSSSLQSLGDDDSNMNLMNVDVSTLTPAERRRYERNMREQQRSYRISQQIKQLRDCLEENKIPFKPNKFSILVSIVEYIKQLQARSIMLDSEHARLMQTLTQTTELVQSDKVPSVAGISTSSDEEPDGSPDGGGASSSSSALPDIQSAEWLVQGLDYYTVFLHCPAALGIASLDGRVLSCNSAFEELLAVDQKQILQQSMFMYIRNHQDVFEAMADLLKRSSVASESVQHQHQILYWCGYVISLQAKKLAFSITLTNTASGDPKYFSLSASDTLETFT